MTTLLVDDREYFIHYLDKEKTIQVAIVKEPSTISTETGSRIVRFGEYIHRRTMEGKFKVLV